MYQRTNHDYINADFCNNYSENDACICRPGSEDCIGLEVKLNNYDTGNSCGSEDPNTVKGGFLRYKWDCHQIETEKVYVLSDRQKPIPVNEIIVTSNDLSKSGPLTSTFF